MFFSGLARKGGMKTLLMGRSVSRKGRREVKRRK